MQRGPTAAHTRNVLLPSRFAAGAAGRRGGHQRDGAVFRPVSLQNLCGHRLGRQDDHHLGDCRTAEKTGLSGLFGGQHRLPTAAAHRADRAAGPRCGGTFQLPADFHAPFTRCGCGHQRHTEPSGCPQGYAGIHRCQKEHPAASGWHQPHGTQCR